MEDQELLLYHEIMLLSLKDREGTPVNSLYPFALSTAVLSELILRNRIEISSSVQRNVSVVDATSTGITILDKCLIKLIQDEELKPLIHWIKRAFDPSNLINFEVTKELCSFGILKKDEKQTLWVFSKTTFPELNPVPEKRLKQRLCHLLLNGPIDEELTPESYERTAVVAVIARKAPICWTPIAWNPILNAAKPEASWTKFLKTTS